MLHIAVAENLALDICRDLTTHHHTPTPPIQVAETHFHDGKIHSHRRPLPPRPRPHKAHHQPPKPPHLAHILHFYFALCDFFCTFAGNFNDLTIF